MLQYVLVFDRNFQEPISKRPSKEQTSKELNKVTTWLDKNMHTLNLKNTVFNVDYTQGKLTFKTCNRLQKTVSA